MFGPLWFAILHIDDSLLIEDMTARSESFWRLFVAEFE